MDVTHSSAPDLALGPGRLVAVLGAGGAVGEAIARRLIAAGHRVRAGVRRPGAAGDRLAALGAAVTIARLEAPEEIAALFVGADAGVATPILTESLAAAPALAALDRAIVFSSNNVAVAPDDPVYAALAAAEAQWRAIAPRATIVRPTLLYGDPRLKAVPDLMALMRRTPVMPVPGLGRALQQPLFVEDAAALVVAALDASDSAGRTLAIGGPDVLSLRALYAAVSRAAGGVRVLAPTPRALLRLAAYMGAPLSAAQIARAHLDKTARRVDPLPAGWAPATDIRSGLAHLARRLGQAR